jgi:hypothetical protein
MKRKLIVIDKESSMLIFGDQTENLFTPFEKKDFYVLLVNNETNKVTKCFTKKNEVDEAILEYNLKDYDIQTITTSKSGLDSLINSSKLAIKDIACFVLINSKLHENVFKKICKPSSNKLHLLVNEHKNGNVQYFVTRQSVEEEKKLSQHASEYAVIALNKDAEIIGQITDYSMINKISHILNFDEDFRFSMITIIETLIKKKFEEDLNKANIELSVKDLTFLVLTDKQKVILYDDFEYHNQLPGIFVDGNIVELSYYY